MFRLPLICIGIAALVGVLVLRFSVVAEAVSLADLQFGQMPVMAALLSIENAFLVLLTGILLLALVRGREVNALQNTVLEMQAHELMFQDKALNEHSILCITDPESKIISVNDKFVAAFGYERDDILGKSNSFLYPEKEYDVNFSRINSAVGAGEIWTGEEKLRTKSGRTVLMQSSVIPLVDFEGHHIKNVSMRTDITAARLSEARNGLMSALDLLQDEVYVFCANSYRLQYLNKTAARRCGWTQLEAVTMRIIDAETALDMEALNRVAQPLLNGDKKMMVYEAESGGRSVEVSIQLISSPDDSPLFIAFVRNIAERKAVERARTEFVSIVSHELRSPLTSIKGALALVNSGVTGPVPDKTDKVIDIAYRNAQRMLLVVNDILDLEKIEAGKMDFSMAPVDLSEFLTEAIAANKGLGDAHDVRIVGVGLDKPATVMANSDRLMQVISNLVSNAAKFSAPGENVELSLAENENTWRVTISDTGPGIPEAARGTIFDKFTQFEASDGKTRKGTGLGLNIARTIVERHRGKIDFHSTIGNGTDFFFELPKKGLRHYACEQNKNLGRADALVNQRRHYSRQEARVQAAGRLEKSDVQAKTNGKSPHRGIA